MRNNWVAIYDGSKDGTAVFVSDSITEFTQYEPAEFIGKTGYSIFYPDDYPNVEKMHIYNVRNQHMSSMVTHRLVKKNGECVECAAVVITCYDLVVICHYSLDVNSLQHKMRVSAVDEWYSGLSEKRLQKVASWKVHKDYKASGDQIWDQNNRVKPQEKRVCLVLNRFTQQLNIVYASSLATEILGVDPAIALGQPIYNFIPPDDAMALHYLVEVAKAHDMIFRVRFDWIMDKEKGVSEQMEGISLCIDDGIVMVLRSAPRIILN